MESPHPLARALPTSDPVDVLRRRLSRDMLHTFARPLLENAVAERHRDPRCARAQLAVAWITGRHTCGCEYEAAVFSFAEVCAELGIDADKIRRQLINGFVMPQAICLPDEAAGVLSRSGTKPAGRENGNGAGASPQVASPIALAPLLAPEEKTMRKKKAPTAATAAPASERVLKLLRACGHYTDDRPLAAVFANGDGGASFTLGDLRSLYAELTAAREVARPADS